MVNRAKSDGIVVNRNHGCAEKENWRHVFDLTDLRKTEQSRPEPISATVRESMMAKYANLTTLLARWLEKHQGISLWSKTLA